MHPDDPYYPALFHRDKACFLNRADSGTGSCFELTYRKSFCAITERFDRSADAVEH
jgi:hypothetical protein